MTFDKPIGLSSRGLSQVETPAVCVTNANTTNQNAMSQSLQTKTVPPEQLLKDWVYTLYKRHGEGWTKRELAVFMHIGSTGMPIFHTLGEPDFQSCFCLNDYGAAWLAIGERPGTKEDLGY